MKVKGCKKLKIGTSFLVLILICLLTNNIILLVNYMLALILHELAHMFVAVKNGYAIKQFKICAFGVSAELDEQIEKQDMFAINLAGPLCNLLLCVLCLAVCFIFPRLFVLLKDFCLSNVILATFNLLPVYPLDGGKIFAGIIKDNKKFKHFNNFVRILCFIIFLLLFLLSGLKNFNFFYLLISVFFLVNKCKEKPSFSLFKHRKHKKINKVELVKIDEHISLFELLKLIKTHKYTIFFCPTLSQKYIDEDKVIELSLKHPLTEGLNRILN